MQILQGPRASGKTTDLIKASALTGAVIVTSSKRMVEEIRRMADRLDLSIPMPLLYKDVLRSSHKMDGRRDIKILIDDLDIFLQDLTSPNVRITGATLTPTVEGSAREAFYNNPYREYWEVGSGWKENLVGKQGDIKSIFDLMSEKY